MKNIALALIQIYQKHISPLLAHRCRFAPTCSQYAYEAIQAHGFLSGTRLAAWRILRCHPFTPGGSDPVPSAGRSG